VCGAKNGWICFSLARCIRVPSSAFHGLLVVDKPGGMTSRAVVDRVQRWFPRGTRIGHTGTLDPLATGVLVLGLGAATRLTEYVQRMTKTYRAGILLGSRSDTDDADGTVTPVEGITPPDRAAVEAALSRFVGIIEQVPPAFSAAKVTGRRAYDLARRGHEIALPPRRVAVEGIGLLDYDYPRLAIEVRCGKGTYIRSLARDLGERLGCGGLIEALRRTQIGPFCVEAALALDVDAHTARQALRPLAWAVAGLPVVVGDADDLARLRQGLAIAARAPLLRGADEVAVCDSRGQLVAVGRVDADNAVIRPEKVLAV
jgi:tRNA pseudouridine55 synthase